jgi:hypothetical protein
MLAMMHSLDIVADMMLDSVQASEAAAPLKRKLSVWHSLSVKAPLLGVE